MPKIQSFDRNMTEVQVEGGKVLKQDKKGQFDVNEKDAKFLKRSGAFIQIGAGMATIQGTGFRCQACGFLAMFKDHCGRCGGTELVEE